MKALTTVADVVIAGETRVDIPLMVDQLHGRGLAQVLCEGGPALFGSLLAADAVDELCLTVAPRLEAGGAMRVASGMLLEPRRMELDAVLEADSTLLLRYRRVSPTR